MKQTNKLGILIPVFNESESIYQIVDTIKKLKFLKDNFETFQVLVVDDGSTDDTSSQLLKLSDINVITHGYNMGVGAAVRNGLLFFEEKNFDYVVKLDGDLQHDPNEIEKILLPLINNESDLVYGDRFSGNIDYKMPKHRKFGNKFFSYLMKKLTKYNITDSQPGFFAGNKKFLKNFYILTNYNYTQQIIYSSYLAGLRFCQVPINFRERVYGSSFVKFSYPFKAILQIFLMMVIKKPLIIFGNTGLSFLLFAILISIFQLINYFSNDLLKPIQNTNLVLGFGIAGIVFLLTGIILKAIQNLEETKRR